MQHRNRNACDNDATSLPCECAIAGFVRHVRQERGPELHFTDVDVLCGRWICLVAFNVQVGCVPSSLTATAKWRPERGPDGDLPGSRNLGRRVSQPDGTRAAGTSHGRVSSRDRIRFVRREHIATPKDLVRVTAGAGHFRTTRNPCDVPERYIRPSRACLPKL